MTWKAESLRNAYEQGRHTGSYGMGYGLEHSWKMEGRDLTYEDYWIYVCLIGHRTYRDYNVAHWRDVDITTGEDVWKKLQEDYNELKTYRTQKAY